MKINPLVHWLILLFLSSSLLVCDWPGRSAAFVPGLSQAARAQSNPSAGAWQAPVVVDQGYLLSNIDDHNTAVDAQGRLHLVFGAAGLHYWLKDTSGWHDLLLDPQGYNPSLALDSQGWPHIAYRVYAAYADYLFKYTWFDGTAWQTELIEEVKLPDVGLIALALDHVQAAHVIYVYSRPDHQVRYAVRTASGWTRSFVPVDARVTDFSVSTDLANQPGVAFVLNYATGDDRLIYAAYNGSAWSFETVEANGAGRAIATHSLTSDSLGRPRLAYLLKPAGESSFSLRYAQRSSSWSVETPALGSLLLNDSAGVSLRLKADDSACMAFLAIKFISGSPGYQKGVHYACQGASGWQDSLTRDHALQFFALYALSLALGPGEEPHILFENTSSSRLYLVEQSGATWTEELVAEEKSVSGFAVKMDSLNRPLVFYTQHSYLDYPIDQLVKPDYQLRRATLDSGAWQRSAFPPLAVSGGADLALNASGQPLLSYYQPMVQTTQSGGHITTTITIGGLVFAAFTGSTWLTATVDSDRHSLTDPYITSLHLDAQGHAHISYAVYPPGSLDYSDYSDARYAFQDGSRWYTETVDNGSYRSGLVNALDLDTHGWPYILYSECNQYQDPCLSSRGALQWNREAIAFTFSDYTAPAFGLDSSDQPHMAFYRQEYDGDKYQLVYGSKSGKKWTYQVIEANANPVHSYLYDRNVSLVYDSAGYPHLLYALQGSDYMTHLRHAWFDGTSWQKEEALPAATATTFSVYPKLALDIYDTPHAVFTNSQGSGAVYYTRRARYGATLKPAAASRANYPGQPVTYTLTVNNIGDFSDSFRLSTGGNQWATDPISTTVGPLAPGASQELVVSVHIPAEATLGASDSVVCKAASLSGAGRAWTARLTSRAGSPLNFVHLPLLRK